MHLDLRGFRARKGQLAHRVFKDQKAHAEFKGLRDSMVSMGPIRLFPGRKATRDQRDLRD